jgi:hypothetical protein
VKPIPEELRALYPSADGLIPERPWWRSAGRGMRRRDGVGIADVPPRYEREGYFLCPYRESDGGKVQHTLEGMPTQRTTHARFLHDMLELVRAIDAKHPVEHPGFRVGQVWGYVERFAWAAPGEHQVIVTQLIGAFKPSPGNGGPVRFTTANAFGDPVHRTEPELRKWLHDAFLLADPCCPWLAPWGPAEEPVSSEAKA